MRTRFENLGFFIGLSLVSVGIGNAMRPFTPFETKAAPPLASEAPAAVSPFAQAGAAVGDPNVFVSLAQRVMPSVVNISTISRERAPGAFRTPEDMLEEFFGGPRRAPGPRSGSLGTGFVIDSSGIILTNHHVVANADEIRVSFTESPDEKPVSGNVIARDPDLDIALIRVKTDRPLQALPFGDSDALRVGEYVAAVGNPFGQGHSMSHGIISAKGRMSPGLPLATYLQTDAPINPGNSGGPLINLRGEVVGINNAIDARAQGIGFAIPVNAVKSVLPQLRTKGTIARGYIGVVVADLSSEMAEKISAPRGLKAPLVVEVAPGGPAYRAGIRPYDIITELDGAPVRSAGELTSKVTGLAEGSAVPIRVTRDAKTLEFKVRLGKRPSAET